MAKISTGGVSDRNVDENYIAPPGVAPETALEQNMPDAGKIDKKTATAMAEKSDDKAKPAASARKRST